MRRQSAPRILQKRISIHREIPIPGPRLHAERYIAGTGAVWEAADAKCLPPSGAAPATVRRSRNAMLMERPVFSLRFEPNRQPALELVP